MDHSIEQIELLYRETGPSLLAYFRRRPALTPVAEDLLQDTFVRALRRPDRLATSVSPRAYLFGIARHVGQDALRRWKPVVELTEATAGPVVLEDARLESVREVIASLPETQREALQLKLQHALTYEEIAEVLGIPIGTVRSRLHHAVRMLRETFQPTPKDTP